MLKKLIKLANRLDNIEQYKIAEYIDFLIKFAAKVDKLKEKYPEFASDIDELNAADPSSTKKYLDWMVKQYIVEQYNIELIENLIKDFHIYYQKLENKDINFYTLPQLEDALNKVKSAPPSKRQMKEVSKSGADTIYESQNYIVIHPKTKDAVCTYGAGTKWCITMKDQHHFEDYSNRGVIFYYILDRHPKDDIMNKVAIAFHAMDNKGLFEVFNAKDHSIDMNVLKDYYGSEWPAIENSIKTHSKTEGIKSVEEYTMDIALNGTKQQKTELAYRAASEKILAILANDEDKYIRLSVSNNRNTSPETLLILSKDKSTDVKINVAKNNNTPLQALLDLSKDQSVYVRRAVVENDNVTQDILINLSNDDDINIRTYVAENKYTPTNILDVLATDESPIVRRRTAQNLNTSPKALMILSKDSLSDIRDFVALNPNAPEEALNDLANDPRLHERVAKNPNTSTNTLLQLLQYASTHPNFLGAYDIGIATRMSSSSPRIAESDELFNELFDVGTKHKIILEDLLKNPYLSLKRINQIAMKLAKDPGKDFMEYVGYRRALARNYNTDAETLLALSKDPDISIRTAVAINKMTPSDILSSLAEDVQEDVRYALIKNPNITKEVLNKLIDDEDPNIKGLAISRLKELNKTVQSSYKLENINVHLIKLANQLDNIGHHKIAEYIDVLIKIAAKADRLKEQYPKLSQDIDKLNERDPSPTKKYLEWGVKQFNTGLYTIDEVGNAIKQFHLHHQKLENKDINSYKTVEEVERALVGKDLPSKRQMKEISKSGADTIYESPNYVVIHPKTKDAVCTYGAGTKWCITMRSEQHFEHYSNQGIVFYYILDRHPKDEIMNKVAIALNVMKGNGVFEIFDAKDRLLNINVLADYYGDEWQGIENAIKTHSKAEGMKTAKEYMIDKAKNGDYEERFDIANNPNMPSDILIMLAKDEEEDIRAKVAKNPNTPQEILDALSKDKSVDVRAAVAFNKKTPLNILLILAQDNDEHVRTGVAGNINTPSNILSMLAKEKDSVIRMIIAKHPNATLETLTQLAKDQDYNVRNSLAHSKSAPASIFDLLTNDTSSSAYGILETLSSNPNTPPHILDGLAFGSYKLDGPLGLKSATITFPIEVAMNPNTSLDTLQKLLSDGGPASSYAQMAIQQRSKQSLRKSKLQKLSQQLQNLYFPIGQKGNEYGGNVDQESEVPEEINEEMEAKDMENYTPGNDNLIIDKMDNSPVDMGSKFAKNKNEDILFKENMDKLFI